MLNEHYPQLTEKMDEHGQSVLLRQFYGSGNLPQKSNIMRNLPRIDNEICQI